MKHSPLKVSSFTSASQTKRDLCDACDLDCDGGDFARWTESGGVRWEEEWKGQKEEDKEVYVCF